MDTGREKKVQTCVRELETVMEHGEHFFHTEEHLECYRQWLREEIE